MSFDGHIVGRRTRRSLCTILAGWMLVLAGCGPNAPAVGSSAKATRCPLCGGVLVKLHSIADDRDQPSKNLAVWNRSSDGVPLYDADASICSRCWLVHSELSGDWNRSSELPDSFQRPLSKGIRECPLPPAEEVKSPVVYSQHIHDSHVRESVSFWCRDSDDLLDACRDHARQHKLSFHVDQQERIPGQVVVTIDTEPVP